MQTSNRRLRDVCYHGYSKCPKRSGNTVTALDSAGLVDVFKVRLSEGSTKSDLPAVAFRRHGTLLMATYWFCFLRFVFMSHLGISCPGMSQIVANPSYPSATRSVKLTSSAGGM